MNQTLFFKRLMQIGRFMFVLLILTIVTLFIYYGLPLLYPFLIGLVIAYIINKPVTFLQRKGKIPRWLAVTLVLFVFVGAVFTLATVLVAEVVVELTHLMKDLPGYIKNLSDYFRDFFARDIVIEFYEKASDLWRNYNDKYSEQIENNLSQGFSKVANGGSQFLISILGGIQGFLAGIPNAATVLVISLLASFFISKDYFGWREKGKGWLPKPFHGKTRLVLNDLKNALVGFIKAQLTLITITAVIVTIGLLILRVKYAITIGLITGLVDLLPYLGTGAVFIPWIIYLFVTGNYGLVIGLSILYAVVVVQRQIMEPKILATNVGLDPLVALIALFAGLQLFGFLGLIIGPVVVVVFNALQRAGVFRDVWGYIVGEDRAV